MLTRFITILSLMVFFILMMSGSTLEPALIKGTVVFFSLVIGFNVCRYLVSVIKKSAPAENESSPSHDAA